MGIFWENLDGPATGVFWELASLVGADKALANLRNRAVALRVVCFDLRFPEVGERTEEGGRVFLGGGGTTLGAVRAE